MNEKMCTRCKVVKLHSEFYADKKHKDGLASACKTCVKTGAMQSKINKILAKNSMSTESLEAQENLNRKKLCEAGICPDCKRLNIIPDPLMGYICGWCTKEYDKNGALIGE